MIILDTDIFTLLQQGQSRVVQNWQAATQANPNEQIVLTIVTWAEAMRGRIDYLLKASDGMDTVQANEYLQETLDFLEDFEVISFTDAAALEFDNLQKQKKKPKRRADFLIVCIALANDAVLVTGNTKDYSMVNGLKLEDWTKS